MRRQWLPSQNTRPQPAHAVKRSNVAATRGGSCGSACALAIGTSVALQCRQRVNGRALRARSSRSNTSRSCAGERSARTYMRETGAQMLHVPYNAPGTATTNLIAGEIQLMFQLIPGIAGQVKSGKVRAIAVMAPQRSPGLPDVPTTAELGQPRLLSSTWFALLAPKGTPSAVLQKMNAATNEALADPAVKKRLADIGVSTLGGTPEQLAKTIADETEKWGRVVREAKIQAQ